jgi:hypothetical protein
LNPNVSPDPVGRLRSFSQATKRAMTTSTAKLLLIPLFILTASCARRSESKPSAAPPHAIYATPTAVFDAYREARRKREWRKCFDCLTPDSQKDQMFEIYFACGMSSSNEVAAMCKKYIGERETFNDDYERRYKEKHGVSIEDVRAKEQTEKPRGPTATSDRDLIVEVLNAHIQDKAGFYEAAANLLNQGDNYEPLGELKQLTVEGDTASGQAESMMQHLSSSGDGVEKVVRSRHDKTFHFRQVNGGWLIEL